MTKIASPADLFGLGIAAVRPCAGVAVGSLLLAPITSGQGTGLPFVGTAVRIRPEVRQAVAGAAAPTHNSIAVTDDGTPLGIHPSGRPTS